MSLRRDLADCFCRTLSALLPPALQTWGQAIRCETAAMQDDGEALLFAVGGFCGLMPRVIACHLARPAASLAAAVMLGLAYMAMAGAPTRAMGTNLGALIIGLAMMATIRHNKADDLPRSGGMTVAMAALLLATALLGQEVNGASRWIRVGGLALQPGLVLLPAMILAFVRSPGAQATTGMLLAALALAIMPDRANAAMLSASLTVAAIMRPAPHVLIVLGGSLAAFVVTMIRADMLPAAPFVDGLLLTSWHVHLLAGFAVLGGAVLLLVPALTGWRRDVEGRMNHAVFGTIWLTGLVTATCGNVATPVVGYGGSAILGYALSLAMLARPIARAPRMSPAKVA
jgi:cell division protein FtsW (lipid II flippase)